MTCWIFDLDGVVTHLTEKKITNPKLLEYFVLFLQQGDVVTINTGRGIPFIREQVLTPLLEHLNKQDLPESLLSNFFAVGEKGNAWIEDEKDYFDTSTAVSLELLEKVEALVEKDYSDTMFVDLTKKTMVSVEMHTGLPVEKFMNVRHHILDAFEKLLKETHLDSEYIIDPTLTAADIQHKTAGKGLGMQRILFWLTKRTIKPAKFVAFGDSKADLGTGEALLKAGKSFDFVFVGDKELIPTLPSFPIIFTKEKYDKGVIEYISLYIF